MTNPKNGIGTSLLQIESDGRQPLELERTKAWGYSIFNLRGPRQAPHLARCDGMATASKSL